VGASLQLPQQRLYSGGLFRSTSGRRYVFGAFQDRSGALVPQAHLQAALDAEPPVRRSVCRVSAEGAAPPAGADCARGSSGAGS
jgi:hypothetical protein